MASLTLYVGSVQTSPYVLPCFDLDFMTAFTYRGRNDWDFFNGRHTWSQAEPWIGFGVAFTPSFTDTEGKRYELLDGLSGSFPFPDPKWRYNANTTVDLDPSEYTVYTVTSDTAKPDDWDTDYLSYFYYSHQSGDVGEYGYTSKDQTWESFRSDVVSNSGGRGEMRKMKNPCSRLFISHGGLHDFTFGIRTTVQRTVTATDSTNCIVSGMSGDASLPNTNTGYTASNPFMFRDLTTGNALYNAFSVARSFGGTANQGSRRVQTYPVAFTVPKNTILPAGSPASSYPSITFGADTQMLGIMCVAFNAYGLPSKASIQVMSSNMWAAKSATGGGGAGSDTIPTGGKGKQTTSKYDPSKKTITKNTSGGLLTDPTAGAGFVIYKFTPSEFTSFLSKVYTETALPGVVGTVAGVLDEAFGESGIQKGWSNTENIVFVKTSPVSFPSQYKALSKLSIGALGISDVAANVVTDYLWNPDDIKVKVPDDPQWFTDVEPYANCQIFFPLAGAVALPPSVLAGSNLRIKRAYNLLNNSCDYAVFIDKNNSDYMYFAKNGECAKSADCVIPGRDISGTIGSLGALAASGIATLATGGTATPALITSALGAASTAVHESTDLSVSQMPPASSGGPYDDTVYGGLRDIVLYRTKAQRFTSGESNVSMPSRSQVIGNASRQYISKIENIAAGSYFSVLEVQLHDAAGMTKAEADKIVAYLKEGVYL